MYKYDKTKEKQDVDKFVKGGRNDLSVTQYATISGIKGKQFGREIFSSVIPFKDLMEFIEVFPNVQRSINKSRVSQIKRYVLSGLDDYSAMRFFSAITVTCKGAIYYDENTNRLAIDTKESKLSINDGQHRMYGISEAIRELQGKANKTTDEVTLQILKDKLHNLKEMVIPIVIFNGIGESEEKQLFHDLNNLAARPSRSATIKLAQTDYLAIMSRELAVENDNLRRYGVEMDKASISDTNENKMLLTTVYNSLKELFWSQYAKDSKFLKDKNYHQYKSIANETINMVFRSLPEDIHVKNKYVLERNFTFKAICRFIHDCRNKYEIKDEDMVKAIQKVDWTPNFSKWSLYGGTKGKNNRLIFGGHVGVTAVYNYLLDMVKFGVGKELKEKEEVVAK